jgi:Protein of unknown function (DUF2786)
VRVEESRPRPGPGGTFADAASLLRTAALARAVDEPDCADRIVPLLHGRFALRPHTVDLAVDATVRDAAHELLTHGWTPAEMHAFAAKRLDPVALTFLVDALAGTAKWTVGAPWLAQLRTLSAVIWWSSAEPHVRQWSARHDRGRAETLRVVVDVLALLAYVPRTDAPQPGMPAAVDLPPDAVVDDERLAGRIDALLTRAGRTDFAEEARACAAKAQELLLRYAARPPVRERVRADPRRLVTVVGAEVAGLLQRAATVLGRRPRPAPALSSAAGPDPAAAASPALVGRIDQNPAADLVSSARKR